jgi:hypothetical protein
VRSTLVLDEHETHLVRDAKASAVPAGTYR